MACTWESIRFYTDDSTLNSGHIEGKVTGCVSNKVIVSFPDYPGISFPIDVNQDGTFREEVKMGPFDIGCDDPIRMLIVCQGSTDPSCTWDSQLRLECICPTPYVKIAPPDENYMSLDQFSVYDNLVQPDGSPPLGCNINGPYRLRVELHALDADITWTEQILDGSASSAQELPGTANQAEITYNLNAPDGVTVLVTALVMPKGKDTECPITSLTVPFEGCGVIDCESYGYHEGPNPGECRRCPPGQVWDPVKKTCLEEQELPGPPEPPGPPGPPKPPKLPKFCKCKKWWCYLLGGGLALLIGLYILGAFNCLMTNSAEITGVIWEAILGMGTVSTILDSIGIGTAIVLFWRVCGACCTECAIWLGIIIGVLAVIVQTISGGLPLCWWPAGILVIIGLILIALTFHWRCEVED